MNKIICFLLFLSLANCAKSSNGNSNQTGTLISYEKYDFVNAAYVGNSSLVILMYTNGFSITKPGCDTVFFDSSDTSLPQGTTKTLTGTNESEASLCYPREINIEIMENSAYFNNKRSFAVKLLSDMYNMFLE